MTSEKWAQKLHTDSLRSRRRLLMTYPDLGSASNWLKQISHASQPIRGTTQIWEATCHQYGISSRGGVTKCWLFPVADPGEGPTHLPLFLAQTEAQRAEIFFVLERPPPPIPGSGWPGRPLSEGQDLPLVSLGKPRPPMELNLWLSLSAKHCWNPCFGPLPVYQDLSMRHDWPV